MQQSELAPYSADAPPDFSGTSLEPISRPIGSILVPATFERNVAMPPVLPRLLSDLGVANTLEICPIITSGASTKSSRVRLSSGLRSYRLVLEYVSFRTTNRGEVRVNTLQRDARVHALLEADLLATLLHRLTDPSWLVRALIKHRESPVWRSPLSIEQIATLADVSSREVRKHV